tara:strand:+ start:357 stop:713 length:357 start_codon:yes stop_codon:yes gene_type:complete
MSVDRATILAFEPPQTSAASALIPMAVISGIGLYAAMNINSVWPFALSTLVGIIYGLFVTEKSTGPYWETKAEIQDYVDQASKRELVSLYRDLGDEHHLSTMIYDQIKELSAKEAVGS